MKENHIIGIQGVPRSGTSWLGQIVNASRHVNFKFQPLFSYAFKDYLSESSTNEHVIDFLNEISTSDNEFINLHDIDLLGAYPKFKKNKIRTHLVFKQVRYHFLIEKFINCGLNVKFLLVERHPLEVLNSWRKAPREFNPSWNFNEEWLNASKKNQNKKEEYFGYNKWKEAMHLFHYLATKYKNKVKIVNYRELKHNTTSCAEDIFNFINLQFENQVTEFINESTTRSVNHPNSVYKANNQPSTYNIEISQEIQDFIYNDLKNTPLKYLLD